MLTQNLQAFFLWCTIINAAILAVSFIACAIAGNFIYRTHSKWFPMPRETFSVVLYTYLGFYKLFILIFNLAPLIALTILKK